MTTRYVSATYPRQKFAGLLDDVERGLMVIRRRWRDQSVVISPREYARLRGLAVADFQRFCDGVGARAAKHGITQRALERLLRR